MQVSGFRFALPALALWLGACGEDVVGPAPQMDALPRPLSSAERAVISGSNDFAFSVLREVATRTPDGNVFLSPLSISMALGMTMNGAAGSTFDEIRSTLGFEGLSQSEINGGYEELTDLLLGLDPAVDLALANSVWYRQGFPFERSFLDTASVRFDAEVAGLDFEDPGAPDRINDWVERATNGRIETIVDEIQDDQVMFLINALHFKGSWRQRFDPARTRDDSFVGLDGQSMQVRMMNGQGVFGYAATADYEALDLPYGNGAFTMTIVMPARERHIDDLLATLNASKWEELLGGLAPQRLDVAVPRFRLEFEKGLVPTLQALGIRAAFHPGGADFSKMSSAAGTQLYLTDVKHKTFVDVNEEGSEAAAVTSVEVGVTSAGPSFRADRPFVFVIRERFSGTLLFAGKIVSPAS